MSNNERPIIIRLTVVSKSACVIRHRGFHVRGSSFLESRPREFAREARGNTTVYGKRQTAGPWSGQVIALVSIHF